MIQFLLRMVLMISSFGIENVAHARRRSPKPEPTVSAKTEACKQNSTGMLIVARNALNQAVNPLADRVDSMDWARFCNCFGPKHFEAIKTLKEERKTNQSHSYAKYEKLRDAIVTSCTTIGPNKASPPTKAQSSNDLKFS